jgi:hypothetical protein
MRRVIEMKREMLSELKVIASHSTRNGICIILKLSLWFSSPFRIES